MFLTHDPTQPNPWVDPTDGQLCVNVTAVFTYSNIRTKHAKKKKRKTIKHVSVIQIKQIYVNQVERQHKASNFYNPLFTINAVFCIMRYALKVTL